MVSDVSQFCTGISLCGRMIYHLLVAVSHTLWIHVAIASMQQAWCCDHEHRGCPSSTSYDCAAGVKQWKNGWSEHKKLDRFLLSNSPWLNPGSHPRWGIVLCGWKTHEGWLNNQPSNSMTMVSILFFLFRLEVLKYVFSIHGMKFQLHSEHLRTNEPQASISTLFWWGGGFHKVDQIHFPISIE